MQAIKSIQYNTIEVIETALDINRVSNMIHKSSDRGARVVRVSCGQRVGHTDSAIFLLHKYDAILIVGHEDEKQRVKRLLSSDLHDKVFTLNDMFIHKTTTISCELAIMDSSYVLSKINPETALQVVQAKQILVLG